MKLPVFFAFIFSIHYTSANLCKEFQWSDPTLPCDPPIPVHSITVWSPHHGSSLPRIIYTNPNTSATYTIRIVTDGAFADRSPADCRVAILSDPPAINPEQYQSFSKADVSDQYDIVFTHNTDLISDQPSKFHSFIAGGAWVLTEHERIQSKWSDHEVTKRIHMFMDKKKKGISMLFSHKKSAAGQQFRHQVHKQISERHPGLIDFFGTGTGKELPNKEDALTDYAFSVIIENGKNQGNYFSGQLIDAMVSLTVPIYWGKTRFLTTTFDPDGFVFFDKLEELDDILDVLQNQWQNIYASKLDALQCNMKTALNREMTDLVAFRNIGYRLVDEATGQLKCGMCPGL